MAGAPAWEMPGAKFDLDFANGRYWSGSVNINPNYLEIAGLISGGDQSFQSVIYAVDNLGIVRTFPPYCPRITNGMGLWTDAVCTNYALWSRDIPNAVWTKTSVTAAKNQAGADLSSNGASLLTATAANATALQSITLSSTAVTTSAYIKRISGSGTVYMTQDGSAYINIAGAINSSGYTYVSIPPQALTNPTVGFKIATSGDAIAVDFFQTENNSRPSSPGPGTRATVARNIEENTFNTASGH